MKNHWAAVVVCIMATSCNVDPGTQSGSSGGNLPDGDAFPAGAVSSFNRLGCPPDWSAFDEAAGRVIVAANAGLPRGTLIGDRLSSGEDRQHEHELSGSVSVTTVKSKGSEPGPNGTFVSGGNYPFVGTSKPTPAGIPYRQLMVCKKMVEPKADVLTLTAKLHSYFDLDACPSGWKSAVATEGRIVVGLPMAAAADMPMGGEPITSSAPRMHTHEFSSTLVTTPLGYPVSLLDLASVGVMGSYPFTSESDPAAIDIPMIALLHCEKQ